MAEARRDEIPPGTLYMLILKTLARERELHGYEIANSIQQISEALNRQCQTTSGHAAVAGASGRRRW